ncbi:3-oxoacyl-(acyl-carrier-protein) synthase [Actinoplanes couchii]|nr:3-oxoacyl-(acyl-carrier-protein) synthase [Actinoplanes couchii]
MEDVITVLSLVNRVVPPTRNLTGKDPAVTLDVVTG